MNKFKENFVKSVMEFGSGFIPKGVRIVLPIFLFITTLLVTQTFADGAYKTEADIAINGNEKPDTDSNAIPDTNGNEKSGVMDYAIDVGDVLYISVWQEDDLSQEVIVRPDGKISFPLAGDVPAFCLTFDQLREELSKRLKEYIRDPIVSISLRKMGGKKIIVLGEVGSPGVHAVRGRRTILEAIARAGGFTQHAVPSSVILIKGGLRRPEGIRLDLSSAIKKTDMTQNVALQSEDIVYVPKKFIADVNYFVNQILGPIAKTIWTWQGIETLE
ncbi:MAG TPA: hypothetical protein ENH24_02415 [Nitrospirae bacterium]|nr:hypothetical protein [Nitrospirota bacterium]